MTAELQPDQSPAQWDDHVCVYEDVFEPLSLALAAPLLQRLGNGGARRVLDVACGPGGAALELAQAGCLVTAVDASPAMVARTRERAMLAGLQVDARVMDAAGLSFADAVFDAAITVFGVVLVPDAVSALGEMRRVVRAGGSIALVTWTEPQNYELATMLSAAIDAVWPDRPRSGLPAQLRYREQADFVRLFIDAGLPAPEIERVEAALTAPDARMPCRPTGLRARYGLDAFRAWRKTAGGSLTLRGDAYRALRRRRGAAFCGGAYRHLQPAMIMSRFALLAGS